MATIWLVYVCVRRIFNRSTPSMAPNSAVALLQHTGAGRAPPPILWANDCEARFVGQCEWSGGLRSALMRVLGGVLVVYVAGAVAHFAYDMYILHREDDGFVLAVDDAAGDVAANQHSGGVGSQNQAAFVPHIEDVVQHYQRSVIRTRMNATLSGEGAEWASDRPPGPDGLWSPHYWTPSWGLVATAMALILVLCVVFWGVRGLYERSAVARFRLAREAMVRTLVLVRAVKRTIALH